MPVATWLNPQHWRVKNLVPFATANDDIVYGDDGNDSLFGNYEAVVEASSSAWNKLIAEPGRIASIATRNWTAISQGP